MTQRQAIIALLVGSAASSKCPFGHDSAGAKFGNMLAEIGNKASLLELFPCTIATDATVADFSTDDYDAIVDSVIELYEAEDDEVTDGSNPRAAFAGCLMRLVGHDFMDFRHQTDGSTTGGADACINFEDGDNKGLPQCIAAFNLASAYQPVCGRVSLADFLVIAGEAVMGRTATPPVLYNEDDYYAEGTLAKSFRDGFKFGRITNQECDEPKGLMPNPEDGCKGLVDIFNTHIYSHTGMPWTMTAAISGAHTIGSAKLVNSGYDGFWSDADSQGFFNNDYYMSILVTGWGPELAVDNNHEKNQW